MDLVKNITSLSEDLIFIIDANGFLRFTNEQFSKQYLVPDKYFVDKNIRDIFDPLTYRRLKRHLSDVLSSKISGTYLDKLEYAGKGLWLNTKLIPFHSDDTGEVLVLGVSRDVSGLMHSYDSIITAKSEWEQAIDSLQDLVAVIDTKFRVLRINKALGAYLGIDVMKAKDSICYRVLHKTEKPSGLCPVITGMPAFLGGVSLGPSSKHPGNDRFDIHMLPFRERSGKLKGCVYVARFADLREKSVAGDMKEAVKPAFLNCDYLIFSYDLKVKYTFLDAFPKCDVHPRDIIKKTPYDFFERGVASEMVKAVRKTIETGHETKQIRNIYGMPFMEQVVPVRNSSDELIGATAIFRKLSLGYGHMHEKTFPSRIDCFTPKEREVLLLIVNGLSCKQIAHEMHISHTTVQTHRARIMKKCNVHKTAELVQIALQSGLLK